MMAYDISTVKGSCDDGEYFGDLRIVEAMQRQNLHNVAFFVARSVGRKLGAKRFDIIDTVIQELITLLDDLGNEDPLDINIPDWDKTQLTLEDLLRLPEVSSVEPMDEGVAPDTE